MRRVISVAAVLALAVSLMSGAAPAEEGLGAPDFKERFVEEFLDRDFCGTGADVRVTNDFVGNVWFSDDGTVFKLAFNGRGTYTYDDAAVQDHWAGRVYDLVISGDDQKKAHTHLVVHNGLRAFLKTPDGGMVERDAGNLQFEVEFGRNHTFAGLAIVKNSGPHPDFTDGVWCEAATELLGITG